MAVNFVSPLSRSLLSLLDPSTGPFTDGTFKDPRRNPDIRALKADGPFSDGTYRNPLKNPDIRALKADGPFTDGTFRDPLKNPDMQQQPLLKDPLDIISTPPYPPSRPHSNSDPVRVSTVPGGPIAPAVNTLEVSWAPEAPSPSGTLSVGGATSRRRQRRPGRLERGSRSRGR